MSVVVVSSGYLGVFSDVARNMTISFQGYGTMENLLKYFHLNASTDVMAYVVVDDLIPKEELKFLLNKCVLQISEMVVPRILLATRNWENIKTLVKNPKYRELSIGLIEFEILSLKDVNRIFGTILFENYDIHSGRKFDIEPIKISPLPSLETRFVLNKLIRTIFYPIEITVTVEDNLIVDPALKELRSQPPILRHLRELIIYKSFEEEYQRYNELKESIDKIENMILRTEYILIYQYIEEVFDAGIYQQLADRISGVSK